MLLPALLDYPLVGLILLVLALFWSFYFTATGGSAVVGSLATVGIALSTAVGSVSGFPPVYGSASTIFDKSNSFVYQASH